MSKIVEIIKKYNDSTFFDEDGNELKIELSTGASNAEIDRFERKEKVILPAEFKNLLMFSNGLNLFGLQILSLDEIELFSPERVMSFHSWGNGDFDCLALYGNFFEGKVLFMHHSVENLILIKNSIAEWVESVIMEVKSKGTLLHPFDYERRNEEGVYKQVLKKL